MDNIEEDFDKCLKFALHSGFIISKNDGEEHFVNYSLLMRLYNLDRWHCIEWDEQNSIGRNPKEFIHLYPICSGNYRIRKKYEIKKYLGGSQ